MMTTYWIRLLDHDFSVENLSEHVEVCEERIESL